MSSQFYGFYGYYFSVKMKVGQVAGVGKFCPDHPEYTKGHDDIYCSICAKELIPRTSEDEDMTYYEMTQEGTGNLSKRDINYMEKHLMPFGEDADTHYEHIIPQSFKNAFGVYLDSDDDHTTKPPKIEGMVATRKNLHKEIAMLKKHYDEVELVFGLLTDYC